MKFSHYGKKKVFGFVKDFFAKNLELSNKRQRVGERTLNLLQDVIKRKINLRNFCLPRQKSFVPYKRNSFTFRVIFIDDVGFRVCRFLEKRKLLRKRGS